MNVFARYAFSVGKFYPTMVDWKRVGVECTMVKKNTIDLIEVTKRSRYRYNSMNDLSYLCHALRVLFQLLLQGFNSVGFLAK